MPGTKHVAAAEIGLRMCRHLLMGRRRVRRAFSPACLRQVEQAIAEAEQSHAGEIRFVVEGALDLPALLRGQTAHARALELFSLLRVWDTAHNNGVLLYVLLADRAVELVADRGIHARAGAQTWRAICQEMEAAYARSQYQAGTVAGVHAIGRALQCHFPRGANPGNALPDTPSLLM